MAERKTEHSALVPQPSLETWALTLGERAPALPVLFSRASPAVRKRVVEFFTAEIRNPHTRRAYGRAVGRFCLWCEERGLRLENLQPVTVAAYVEELGKAVSAPSVKQQLAAIRRLFDYLIVGGTLPFNPASAVRGPRYSQKVGKTPVLTAKECRGLLDSIDPGSVLGLRDRALISVMTFGFARVGATVKMEVRDFYRQGDRAWLRLHEKGGKFHRIPAHHTALAYLSLYLTAAGIGEARRTPLFRAIHWLTGEILEEGITEAGVLRMVKRRAVAAGLPREIGCHSFRATGITDYLANGGELGKAQRLAGHESPRTTQLYDRTGEEMSREEIERIRI
jgi:site-specific recombinase XerD